MVRNQEHQRKEAFRVESITVSSNDGYFFWSAFPKIKEARQDGIFELSTDSYLHLP